MKLELQSEPMRAYRKDIKAMGEVICLDFEQKIATIQFPAGDESYSYKKAYAFDSDNIVFLRPVGIKDKNGTPMYEGNLIVIDQEDEEELFQISWDEDTARFVMVASTYTLDFDNYNGHDCEVVTVFQETVNAYECEEQEVSLQEETR